MITAQPITIRLDPEWNVMRRFECGHVQHACCMSHLDNACDICPNTTRKTS